MKKDKVIETIPKALRDFHQAGHEQVYINQLGQRVMQYDTEYMAKRQRVNTLLARVGIHRSELPDGHTHPRAFTMYGALDVLVGQGIVERVPDPDAPSPLRARTMYVLANFEPAIVPLAPMPEVAQ